MSLSSFFPERRLAIVTAIGYVPRMDELKSLFEFRPQIGEEGGRGREVRNG